MKLMSLLAILVMIFQCSLGLAQDQENAENEIQNDDIIKTELLIGNQYLGGHGSEHLVINGSGESNVFYNQYGHLQILPFKVFIFTHYEKLETIQIKNLKINTLNFVLDQYHMSIGAPTYGQQKLGFGSHALPVKTISPVTISGFHQVHFDQGKSVLEISGYISAPGAALGFGENSRYEWEVDGNHNGGMYVPAGASINLNYRNKVQVKGFADFQNFSSRDKSQVGKDVIKYNEIQYGLKTNLNLGELLTDKIRGVNLYAEASMQNLQFTHQVDNQSTLLNKQNWFQFQVGAGYTFQKKKKPVHPVLD